MPVRKTKAATKAFKPLIRIERIVYLKTTFRISERVLANLAEYVSYLTSVSGHEPAPDEVVDQGLRRLFEADLGFRQWLRHSEPTPGSNSAPVSNELSG
jgi:hypothetical protein